MEIAMSVPTLRFRVICALMLILFASPTWTIALSQRNDQGEIIFMNNVTPPSFKYARNLAVCGKFIGGCRTSIQYMDSTFIFEYPDPIVEKSIKLYALSPSKTPSFTFRKLIYKQQWEIRDLCCMRYTDGTVNLFMAFLSGTDASIGHI